MSETEHTPQQESKPKRSKDAFQTPIEEAMRASDSGREPVRATMLNELANRLHTSEPASYTRIRERELMPSIEGKKIKTALVRAAFVSWTLTKSSLEELAYSKGYDISKVVNEASYALTAQLWGVRTVEFGGTHLSTTDTFNEASNEDKDEVDGLYNKIRSALGKVSRSRILPDDIGSEVWGEYCARSSQPRLLYPGEVGKSAEANAFPCSVEKDSTEIDPSVAKNIAEVLYAAGKSYREIAQDAEQSGQPIGYLNRNNSRSLWNESEGTMPIVLTKEVNGKIKTYQVHLDPTKDEEASIADLQGQIDTAIAGGKWKDIGKFKKALFAFNIQTQDRVLSTDAAGGMTKLTNVQRPGLYFYEGINARGERCLEVNANHTVIDGITLDAFLNGASRFKIEDGQKKLEKKYTGLVKVLNDRHIDSADKQLVLEGEYPEDGSISYEMYPTIGNEHDVIIARGMQEAPSGADVLQTAVLFANDIFIKYMRETRGGKWNEMCVGVNNTHVNKNNPLSRLIPASVYYIGPERYKGAKEFEGIEESVSFCRALQEYKANKWLAENYKTIKDDPQFREHPMPASSEAMAIITESNMDDRIQELILMAQTSVLFDGIKNFITYPQTIVSDNGTDTTASTHKTVGNEALPGISQRQNGQKIEFVFSAGATSEFIPPNQLELYAKFVMPLAIEISNLMSEYQKSQSTEQKMSINDLNQHLVKARASNLAKLKSLESELGFNRGIAFLKSIKNKDILVENESIKIEKTGEITEAIEGKVVSLVESVISLDSQNINDQFLDSLSEKIGRKIQLTEQEMQILKKFKKIEITAWSNQSSGEVNMFDNKSTKVLLAGGLASNEKQWKIRGNSLVHGLSTRFSDSKQGADPLVMYAISCPGFGGTEPLNKRSLSMEDVSEETYAGIIQIVDKIFNFDAVAGHSAGGEAVLKWSLSQNRLSTDAKPVVAFNPAISLDAAPRFAVLQHLGSVGAKVRNNIPSLGRVVSGTESLIVKNLLTLPALKRPSALQAQQIDMHKHEMQVNAEAFQEKCNELSIANQFNAESSRAGIIPRVLLGSQDRLTLKSEGQAFLTAADLSGRLARAGVALFQGDLSAEFITDKLNQKCIVERDIAHDDIFIDPKTQQVAIDMLSDQIRLGKLTKDPRYIELRDSLRGLKQLNFPVHIRFNDTNHSDLSIELDEIHQQETLYRWGEAIQMVKDLNLENGSTIPLNEISKILCKTLYTRGNISKMVSEGILVSQEDIDGDILPDTDIAELFGKVFYEHYDQSNHLNDWLSDDYFNNSASRMLHDFKEGISYLAIRYQNAKDGFIRPDERHIRSLLKLSNSGILDKIKQIQSTGEKQKNITVNLTDIQALCLIGEEN